MQKHGGVSKSFSELIREFHENPILGINPSLTFTRSNNSHLKDFAFLDLQPQRHFFSSSGGLSTLLTLGPVREASSLWSGGTATNNSEQIMHATYYRPTKLERRSARKLVVTVHDFIPEILGWTGVRNPHIGKKRMCQRADKIVSVSNVTTELLSNLYGVKQERIETIHHGVRIKTDEVKGVKEMISSLPSILYVGYRSGYKNFEILLKSVKLAQTRGIILQLVTAGPKLTTEEIRENGSLLGSGLWRHHSAPDDRLLGNLYMSATIHVVTSLMEGFGLTILESMSYGTPTLVSDIPVFREVANESALFFDPNSEESLLSGIEKTLESLTYRHFSSASLSHAKENSWNLAAQKYAKVYAEILS